MDIIASYLPETATLVAFLLASLALNFTPGADMMFVIASGASGGTRGAIAATLGVNFGVIVHILLAAGGLAALLAAEPLAYDVIRYAGAAYLVWLAVKLWRAPPPEAGKVSETPFMSTAWRGFVTNILNPKTALFIFAFIPQFTDPEKGAVGIQVAVLGAVFIVTGFSVNLGVGAVAGAATSRLREASRTMNRLSAIVFGGLAARLVID